MAKLRRTKGMLLILNCDGGIIDSADRIWSVLHNMAQNMPLIAYVQQATSAGYYVASAATEVWANPCSITGSIGIVSVHVDPVKLSSYFGISISQIYSLYDTTRSTGDVFTEDLERGTLERRAKTAHALFIERILRSRRVSRERLEEVADGRLLDAETALDMKLVDGVGNLMDAISRLEVLSSSVKNMHIYIPSQQNRSPMWRGLVQVLLGYLLQN
jgi:protease-4